MIDHLKHGRSADELRRRQKFEFIGQSQQQLKDHIEWGVKAHTDAVLKGQALKGGSGKFGTAPLQGLNQNTLIFAGSNTNPFSDPSTNPFTKALQLMGNHSNCSSSSNPFGFLMTDKPTTTNNNGTSPFGTTNTFSDGFGSSTFGAPSQSAQLELEPMEIDCMAMPAQVEAPPARMDKIREPSRSRGLRTMTVMQRTVLPKENIVLRGRTEIRSSSS